MAPQIIMISLLVAGQVLRIAKHGEDSGKYNAWRGFINIAITVALLWWGGFWKVLGG